MAVTFVIIISVEIVKIVELAFTDRGVLIYCFEVGLLSVDIVSDLF